MLVERKGCIFDDAQLKKSHGYENLDPVAQEAFVNHIHLDGANRDETAKNIIEEWVSEMKAKWPGSVFRIYQHREIDELTVRFHRHRPEFPDWSEGDEALSITIVRT